MLDDVTFMGMALQEARLGLRKGEPPFGALLVDCEGLVIGRAHETVVQDKDMTSHAEIMAVKKACGWGHE